MNKAFAWSSLWIYAFVYALGAFAEILPKPLGQRFVDLLFLRKHLSIISFFFSIIHVLNTLFLLGPNYFSKYYIDIKNFTYMKWNYELSM